MIKPVNGVTTGVPAGLGDNKANIKIKTGNGSVGLTDANNPFKKDAANNGIYRNETTGETLRVSSQGVFGDTWLIGRFSDNAALLNWANNDLAQVGRRTYVERINAKGQVTKADFFRANDQGKILEAESFKPEAGQNGLTEAQVKSFRDKTRDGIGEAQFHNTANAILVPAGIIGAFFALLYGGAAAIGGTAATTSVTATLTSMASALSPLLTRLSGLMSPIKNLLSGSKAFGFFSKALNTLKIRLGLSAFKVPTQLSQVLKWFGVQTLNAAVWKFAEKKILKPVSDIWNKVFS